MILSIFTQRMSHSMYGPYLNFELIIPENCVTSKGILGPILIQLTACNKLSYIEATTSFYGIVIPSQEDGI